MILVIVWVFAPVVDFAIGDASKAQATGFAILLILVAALADRQARKKEGEETGAPSNEGRIELRPLTKSELASLPIPVLVGALFLPLALGVVLADSWAGPLGALGVGSLCAVAVVVIGQRRAK